MSLNEKGEGYGDNMSYTKEDLLELGVEDLESAREKVVSISLFDNLDNITLSNETLEKQQQALELYCEYVDKLLKIPKTRLDNILKILMDKEIIDTHLMEGVDMKYLEDYNRHKLSALKYLIRKLTVEKVNLDSDLLKMTHKILLRGTTEEDISTYKYRLDNTAYVGYEDNEKRIFNYFPISYDEIPQAVELLCNYYNNSFDNVFVKSFVTHGLIGVLQLFSDGNTRLGRCIQHISMLSSTNNLFGTDFSLPIVYLSRSYNAFKYEYRSLLTNLAINANNEAWDEWIRFNYKELIGQIYINESDETLTKKLKK